MKSAEKAKLRRIKDQLGDILDNLDDIKSLEQEYLGKAEDLDYPNQETVDRLQTTVDSLDSAFDNLESALGDLEGID